MQQLEAVNNFRKELHPRCLTGFWRRLFQHFVKEQFLKLLNSSLNTVFLFRYFVVAVPVLGVADYRKEMTYHRDTSKTPANM